MVVLADESVMLLQFSILQCKHTDDKRCPGPDDDHHEFNSVHLGWSRDGFYFNRPPAPRVPFAGLNLSAATACPVSRRDSIALLPLSEF